MAGSTTSREADLEQIVLMKRYVVDGIDSIVLVIMIIIVVGGSRDYNSI
jgi:hypothetical protein